MQPESTTTRPELLTTDEAACYLGTTPGTLAVWRCTKAVHVPFVKVGRLVRYRRRDLEAFLTDNTREG
jgi:excisionase family DNA binding protein